MLPKNSDIPPEIAQLIIPSKYFSAIELAAQIRNESHFNPNAVSDAGAQGIAQIMPSTWKGVGRDDPSDPDTIASPFNVVEALDAQRRIMDGHFEHVNKLLQAGKIHGNPHDLTLAAYNAGIGAVQRAHGIPKKTETQEYIKRIDFDSDRYARAVILEAMNK